MTSERLSRRGMLIGAGIGTAGLAALAVPGSASASENGSGDRLLGGWSVTRSDPSTPSPVHGTATFAAGGAFAFHDINPPGTPFLGTWAWIDDRHFGATMWTGAMDPSTTPPTIETEKVTITGRLDEDGDRIAGSYVGTAFDASGTELGTTNGTFQGTSISATG